MVIAAVVTCCKGIATGTPLKWCGECATNSKVIDKGLKLFDATTDAAYLAVKEWSGSQEACATARAVRQWGKGARDLNALFNIFKDTPKAFFSQFANVIENGAAAIKERSLEKFGKFIKAFLKITALGTYLFAFFVCRTLSNLKNYCAIKLSEGLAQLAGAFGTLMFINHSVSVVDMVIELGEKVQEERSKPQLDLVSFVEPLVKLLEKVLEVIYDIAKILDPVVPAIVRLPLTLAIGGIGFGLEMLKFNKSFDV